MKITAHNPKVNFARRIGDGNPEAWAKLVQQVKAYELVTVSSTESITIRLFNRLSPNPTEELSIYVTELRWEPSRVQNGVKYFFRGYVVGADNCRRVVTGNVFSLSKQGTVRFHGVFSPQDE